MDALEAIHTRRSIRRYTAQPVDEETVERILHAGMMAPSAGNQRPWAFVVTRDKEKLLKISQTHKYATMAADAPVAVLVCGDMRGLPSPRFFMQDCAAATENILLAAHALGLGAVWCGVFPDERWTVVYRELFGLPEYVEPFAFIPMGYPAEAKAPPERFDRSRIHAEKW
jgi:nitroreductase